MKKNIYFIIASIIQILICILVLFNVNMVNQSQIDSMQEMYSSFSQEYQDRMISMFVNNGDKIIIGFSLVCVLSNTITLIEAIRNNILRKKGLMITLSIFSFFGGQTIINLILSIANFIILMCLQRKNPEDFPEKKKEIPKLEYQKSSKKEIILGIVLLVVYFSQFIINRIIPENIDYTFAIVYTICIHVFLLLLSMFIFKDRLKNDIKLFKENLKAYFQFLMPRIGIMYLIFIVVNLLSLAIAQKGVSQNQASLEAMPNWFVIPVAIIWAPIVEECIFRGVIRRFLKNNIAFIAFSAIAFGLVHVLSETSIFSAIIMAMPYAFLGGFLAYIYSKSENICTNIFSHAFFNTIGIVAMNLLLFAVI